LLFSGADFPGANCRRGEPGFAQGLTAAAQFVMGHLAITNRRLEPMIAGALMRRCETAGETLQQAAQMGVRSGLRYAGAMAAGALRFGPWGPAKFWGEGYWLNEGLWPWTQEAREATEQQAAARNVPAPVEALPPDSLPEGLDMVHGRELWRLVIERAAKEINPQSFETWLKPLRGLGVHEGVLYVKMPSRAFEHVIERYRDVLAKFLPEGITAVKSLYLGEKSLST